MMRTTGRVRGVAGVIVAADRRYSASPKHGGDPNAEHMAQLPDSPPREVKRLVDRSDAEVDLLGNLAD